MNIEKKSLLLWSDEKLTYDDHDHDVKIFKGILRVEGKEHRLNTKRRNGLVGTSSSPTHHCWKACLEDNHEAIQVATLEIPWFQPWSITFSHFYSWRWCEHFLLKMTNKNMGLTLA